MFTSPLRRAIETCELAGLGDQAQVRDDLHEWDYGDYEGITTAEIHGAHGPAGASGGTAAPTARPRPTWARGPTGVIAEARAAEGDVIVFGHGHMLRVIGARWVGLPPEDGGLLGLGTGALCTLGYEHDLPVLVHWNLARSG